MGRCTPNCCQPVTTLQHGGKLHSVCTSQLAESALAMSKDAAPLTWGTFWQPVNFIGLLMPTFGTHSSMELFMLPTFWTSATSMELPVSTFCTYALSMEVTAMASDEAAESDEMLSIPLTAAPVSPETKESLNTHRYRSS